MSDNGQHDPTPIPDRERRLDEIVTAYLKAAEAGQAPDREKLLECYPELAAELRLFFADQDALEPIATPLRMVALAARAADAPACASGAPQREAAVPGRLGDFQIVREIGRGGMGVVYEAEQVSLGRKVALKVLPALATLDPRRLQRFHNEARAAASLHHTNIVPVFAVGAEHGVHFYAMQLIDGQSLAGVLGELRRQASAKAGQPAADAPEQDGEVTTAHPPPEGAAAAPSTAAQGALSTEGGISKRDYLQAVARLGVQAAEALDYAHQLGVVHRDVKPGNLMVDGRGQLWVTDFGLAHLSEGGQSLTLTGDLVGTVRYMSPEQALAQRVVIDHRTDVYSLGATLYELLTLRPVFCGDSREELLRQIAFEEPRPLRKLNKMIPAELETIVLKALEKNPAERYATAQELAEDLRRFLEDKPIQARRPSLVQRARKWARRHRPLVAAAAVVAVLALLGSTLSTVLIWQAYEGEAVQRQLAQTAEANERTQRDRAERARQKEAAERQKAMDSGRREADQRRTAQRERDLARRLLYLSDFNLAWLSWQGNEPWRLGGLLERMVPPDGQPDLRNWEWYYLDALHRRSLRLTVGGRSSKYQSLVHQAAWSPDSRFLATAVRQGNGSEEQVDSWSPDDPMDLRLWDVITGQETRRMAGHPKAILDLAWSPDGGRLASASADTTIKVWEAATGQEAFALHGHRKQVYSVAWSPDGRRLASGDWDGTIKVWDAAMAREVFSFKGHQGALVRAVAWSPDGKRLASMCDGSVHPTHRKSHVWDTQTGQAVCTINTEPDQVARMAWSPDSQRLVASSYNTPPISEKLRVWDATTGKPVLEVPVPRLASVASSPDGKWLATRGTEGVVSVRDAHSGQEIQSFQSRPGMGWQLAWSPDGQRLATAGLFWAAVWDIPGKREHLILRGDQIRPQWIAWSPDGEHLLTQGRAAAQVWGVSTSPESIPLVGHTDGVRDLAWAPRGNRLATASRDGTVKVWDTATGEDLMTFRGHSSMVGAIAWSPDGRLLASGDGLRPDVPVKGKPNTTKRIGSPAGSINLWDAVTGQLLLSLRGHKRPIHSLAFSPNGERLASAGGEDRTASIWDAKTGKRLHTFQADGFNVVSVAFSPDGTRLVTGGIRDGIKAWDASTGQALKSPPSGKAVISVAYSPDGKYLAAVANERLVKVWQANTGTLEQSYAGAPDVAFFQVAFSPDSRRLAVVGHEVVKLWDTATWREVLTLQGKWSNERECFPRLAFSADNRQLAVSGGEAGAQVLDASERPRVLYAHRSHPRHRILLRNRPWAEAKRLTERYHWHHEWYGTDTPEAQCDRQGAERAYRQAVDLQEQLLQEAQRDSVRRHELALLLLDRAELLRDTGTLHDYEMAYKAALGILERLHKDLPDMASYRHDLGRYRKELGEVLLQAGQYRDAIQLWRAAAMILPDDHANQNNLSWLLATAPDAKLRDATEAVRRAEKAVEMEPQNSGYWNTLGVARYRIGDWKAAVEALEKGRELRQGYLPADIFFLAMAHWQQGEKEKAGKLFHEMVQWMDRNKPQDEELGRFRAEAAALLDAGRHKTAAGEADHRLLEQILRGAARTLDASERTRLAELCLRHGYSLAAARLCREGFDDLIAPGRYVAACAAALAGTGQGKDADKLSEAERVRWRKQALAWLRPDLVLMEQNLKKNPERWRAAVLKELQRWQADPRLAAVREEDGLAKLPAEEGASWRRLWADVRFTITAAERKESPEQPPAPGKEAPPKKQPAGVGPPRD
jgi:WD40 repeat protein/serine/threonine protein kinase/tetratricopeptide (TPR) repeat protein